MTTPQQEVIMIDKIKTAWDVLDLKYFTLFTIVVISLSFFGAIQRAKRHLKNGP